MEKRDTQHHPATVGGMIPMRQLFDHPAWKAAFRSTAMRREQSVDQYQQRLNELRRQAKCLEDAAGRCLTARPCETERSK